MNELARTSFTFEHFQQKEVLLTTEQDFYNIELFFSVEPKYCQHRKRSLTVMLATLLFTPFMTLDSTYEGVVHSLGGITFPPWSVVHTAQRATTQTMRRLRVGLVLTLPKPLSATHRPMIVLVGLFLFLNFLKGRIKGSRKFTLWRSQQVKIGTNGYT